MTPPEAYMFSTFSTPAGRFSVAVDAAGAVVATAFGGRRALLSRLRRGTLAAGGAGTAAARRQVQEWLGGRRRAFSLRLSPSGTPFQRRVWAAVSRIPFGGTRTYGELARAVGSSPRAVGRAVGANPICPIVPCHRVVGAGGALTGFAFGVGRKRRLLELESG